MSNVSTVTLGAGGEIRVAGEPTNYAVVQDGGDGLARVCCTLERPTTGPLGAVVRMPKASYPLTVPEMCQFKRDFLKIWVARALLDVAESFSLDELRNGASLTTQIGDTTYSVSGVCVDEFRRDTGRDPTDDEFEELLERACCDPERSTRTDEAVHTHTLSGLWAIVNDRGDGVYAKSREMLMQYAAAVDEEFKGTWRGPHARDAQFEPTVSRDAWENGCWTNADESTLPKE